MADYYIKYIDGPRGQEGYPFGDGLVHFAEDQEKRCEDFKTCTGFLLYETEGRGKGGNGAKSIFAYGIIDSDQSSYVKLIERDGKKFPYAAKVLLQKRIDPKVGIQLKKTEEIIEKKIRRAQGGLLTITEDQFNMLCAELDKKSQNLPN